MENVESCQEPAADRHLATGQPVEDVLELLGMQSMGVVEDHQGAQRLSGRTLTSLRRRLERERLDPKKRIVAVDVGRQDILFGRHDGGNDPINRTLNRASTGLNRRPVKAPKVSDPVVGCWPEDSTYGVQWHIGLLKATEPREHRLRLEKDSQEPMTDRLIVGKLPKVPVIRLEWKAASEHERRSAFGRSTFRYDGGQIFDVVGVLPLEKRDDRGILEDPCDSGLPAPGGSADPYEAIVEDALLRVRQEKMTDRFRRDYPEKRTVIPKVLRRSFKK